MKKAAQEIGEYYMLDEKDRAKLPPQLGIEGNVYIEAKKAFLTNLARSLIQAK
jgi:hypothetical protein